MTARQLLDRATQRSLNKDIRFAGQWEPAKFLSGNETHLADAIQSLSGHFNSLLPSQLSRCRTIEDILAVLEPLVARDSHRDDDSREGSLF